MIITDTARLNALIENIKKIRYYPHPSMCGTYPCWFVWVPSTGTTKFKDLRDGLDVLIRELKEHEQTDTTHKLD